ncbi:MAG TPA: hypothetical protein VG347_00705 [Verrucomicrobiae bacterium]|nr:hypothetical protein [Verrucomicrobiae bacterium]
MKLEKRNARKRSLRTATGENGNAMPWAQAACHPINTRAGRPRSAHESPVISHEIPMEEHRGLRVVLFSSLRFVVAGESGRGLLHSKTLRAGWKLRVFDMSRDGWEGAGSQKNEITKRTQLGNAKIAWFYRCKTAVLTFKKRTQKSHEKPLKTQFKPTFRQFGGW